MEMIFQGMSMSLFQAKQQWSRMSSYDLKTRFESQLSRMNCQMFSTGLSSGDFGGNGKSGCCLGWKASSRHAVPPDQEEGWRARRARPQARFPPDEGPWLHCCRRVVRARRLFLLTDRGGYVGVCSRPTSLPTIRDRQIRHYDRVETLGSPW